MTVFKLPDLGEGLQEAEIVGWHVNVGDQVVADQPLLSLETDKAIVEVPSPETGRISKIYGKVGDVMKIGAPLVEFDVGKAQDTATVVGEVKVGHEVIKEQAATVTAGSAGIKVMPAVRALAQRMKVDLAIVTPSGPDGLITVADVERVAKILSEVEPLEALRGVRKAMASNMALAHAEVVAVTVVDDANIHSWLPSSDVTLRLIRAIIAACRAEPSLNCWYDAQAVGRRLLKKVHLGIAVDTEEGLFVPVLRDAGNKSAEALREELERLKSGVKSRTLPADEMRGNTITLSNFGTIAGRYASPIVLPPTVAILGSGKIRDAVIAVNGKPEVRRMLPLSLTFDHRAVTGGEAAHFLAAVLADLQLRD